MKKKIVLLLFLSMFTLIACIRQKKVTSLLEKPYTKKSFQAGTYVELAIYDQGKESSLNKVLQKIDEADGKIAITAGNVSELDQVAGSSGKKTVKVSSEVYQLIKQAKEYSVETKGMYNVAIGAATYVWQIGYPNTGMPLEEDIVSSTKKVDYQKVILNDKEQSIFLEESGMRLDIGGVGKGFLGEIALKEMKKEGVTTGLINLGGHIFVLGDNPVETTGEWTVKVDDPSQVQGKNTNGSLKILGEVKSSYRSFITTNMYSRTLIVSKGQKKKTYSHLFNPVTNRPYEQNEVISVTIFGSNPVENDLQSNAVFNMGIQSGLDYVNKTSDIEAIISTSDKKIYLSNNLKDKFKLNKELGYQVVNK